MLFELPVSPSPRHFHKLDANWVNGLRLAHRAEYRPVSDLALEKGRYIELKRIENWWGDDLKYNKNRFNVDTIRLDVIRDDNVAYEYFLRGELDRFLFDTNPARWHDKARGEIFDKGYAGRIQFYNDVPRYARGFWLNLDDPLLADKNVRFGLAHSLNIDRAISHDFSWRLLAAAQRLAGLLLGLHEPVGQSAAVRPRKSRTSYFDAAGWTAARPGRDSQ